MIRSMTGFGLAERNAFGYHIRVEIKSVNHRYTELMIRMPREWLVLEDGVKRKIQPLIKRGRVDVYVEMERLDRVGHTVEVDWALVDEYRQAAEQIRNRLGLPATDLLTLKDLLQLPDLIKLGMPQEADSAEELEAALLDVTSEAAERLVAVREAEGAHLSRDITERLAALARMHREITASAPAVAEEYRMRLVQRLSELLGDRNGGTVVDEGRIAMEVALLAERSDIQEELTRLESHFTQSGILLLKDEPIGRKLDFYIQEMNREVNTIGSKANRVDIVNRVVDMKAELEKMREQTQNIE